MNRYWKEIEQCLIAKGAWDVIKVKGEATAEEIGTLESHLGVSLPTSVSNFLRTHNGQDTGVGLFFGIHFLSTNDIKSQWDTWYSLKDDGLNEELCDSMSSSPEGAIKPLYLNEKWIPLTHDFGGNHIGLDFDPGPEGKLGQVIIFGRDEDEKKLVANTFDDFLTLFITQLHNEKWDMDDKGWVFHEEQRRKHYHDWYPL